MLRLKWFLAAALAVGAAGLTYASADIATATEPEETAFVGTGSEDEFDGSVADKGGKSDKGKGGKKGGKKGKKGGKGKGKKGGKGKGKKGADA
jgi:hypothetical protein